MRVGSHNSSAVGCSPSAALSPRSSWAWESAAFSGPGIEAGVLNVDSARWMMKPGPSRGLPMVVADEAAEDCALDDLPLEAAGDGTVRWAHLQRPMRTRGVVVTHELHQGPSKVALVQDDDVVQALPPR